MSRRTTTRPEVRVGGIWLSTIVPQGWGELHHQTRVNGAWEASWAIPGTRTWRHPALVAGARVEIFLGPFGVWVGTLAEPDWDAGHFIAEGACRDGETAGALTAAGETSTAPNIVLNAAIARGVVSWTRVGDFGTTPVGESDSSGGVASVQAVLEAWAQEKESNWAIENVPARNLVIRPISEAVVHWYVTPGSGVLGAAKEERVDRVFLRYISSTTGRRATTSYPTSSTTGANEQFIDATDRGAMTVVRAAAIAKGEWAKLQGKVGWTNGLTLKGGQITTPGGTEVDLALVKAGDTMRLLGVPDPRGVARHTDVVIGDTDYDWEDDELQANPLGIAARDEESVLEEVGNLAVDALAKASGKSSLSWTDFYRRDTVLCSPSAANTFITGTITFDKPMATLPSITLTPYASTGTIRCYVTARSINGFSFVFARDTVTDTNVEWTATCLPG